MHCWPFETIHDSGAIQAFFNYLKENVPGDPSAMSVASVAMTSSYSLAAPTEPGSTTESGSTTELAPTTELPPTTELAPEPELPPVYYYVENEQFYLNNSGQITHLSSRPKRVWIYHKSGWSATNRTKQWRWWDGRHDTYR